jgi:CheY-like chemotaxis protein
VVKFPTWLFPLQVNYFTTLRRCSQVGALTPSSGSAKIIAITAHSEAYDRDTVLAAGADEYLLKPIEMETLLEYVGKLM